MNRPTRPHTDGEPFDWVSAPHRGTIGVVLFVAIVISLIMWSLLGLFAYLLITAIW